MFPGGGYSESMPNDEVDESWWCDTCGLYHHGNEAPCDEEPQGCFSCHVIREGAGGVTYSYAILGVLCPRCEFLAEQDYEDEMRARLTDDERTALEIRERWDTACFKARFYYPRPGKQLSPF